ncbi:MAG: hypothetical protein EPO07_10310 [Verrucomicrobia bacterium]|nr:MAG: hypothetical protein EPO07_10310 [Verrucomicrobiota bacterium]
MNLKKWSPLRTSRSNEFREMEERHDSLLLPGGEKGQSPAQPQTAQPVSPAATSPSKGNANKRNLET